MTTQTRCAGEEHHASPRRVAHSVHSAPVAASIRVAPQRLTKDILREEVYQAQVRSNRNKHTHMAMLKLAHECMDCSVVVFLFVSVLFNRRSLGGWSLVELDF